MRFFVLYPERRVPGGGHKQARILTRNLRRLGEGAFLLRETRFEDDSFYDIDVPSADFLAEEASAHLEPDDVLVLSEYRLEDWLAVTRGCECRRAVYAQGGFLALRFSPAAGYAHSGIEFMIAVSPYIAALGSRYLGLDESRAFYVPYPVVRGPFASPPRPFESKRVAVCFMPRKLPEIIAQVRELVAGRFPDIDWVQIDGVGEAEVARRLDENAIFFSTQNGEGFGLPAVEAMSRGCVVTGYRGTGWFPHPYATTENGLWAPDRSVGRAAAQLGSAIRVVRARAGRLRTLLKAGRETAMRYTDEAALEALAGVVSAVRDGSYAGHRKPRHRLGLLGHVQARRALLWTRRFCSRDGDA